DHDEFRDFLGTRLKLVGEARVGVGVNGTRSRALDRPGLDLGSVQAQKEFRGDRRELELTGVEKRRERGGRRRGEPQPVRPWVLRKMRRESLGKVDLVNVAAADELL